MLHMQVNGEDLAGVVGGEVAHSNYHSGRGEPFVIILEFTKPKDMDTVSGTSNCNLSLRHDMDPCSGKSRICPTVDGLTS